MVQLVLKNRGKRINKLPDALDVVADDTIQAVKKLITKATGMSPSRLRLTVPASDGKKKDVVMDNAQTVGDYFSSEKKVTVNVKDLGPQIGWRTVFLIEYLGPLLIHPVLYHMPQLVYGESFEHALDQKVVYVLVLLHFLKREFETAFVHRFSSETMPLFNLFKNSSHYWGLSGVLLGYFAYAPPSKTSILFKREFVSLQEQTVWAFVAAWAFFELSNMCCHWHVATLRAPGSKERKIPTGFGFNLLSFPNYFFEAISWLCVCVIIQVWSSWLFTAVATGQMLIWAVKKHKRYQREFPDYPRNRKAMIPFLI